MSTRKAALIVAVTGCGLLAAFASCWSGEEGSGQPAVAQPKNVGYGGALVQARENARRLKCRNNLREIGFALTAYREANKGKWPEDLRTLVEKKYLDNVFLRCPSAGSAGIASSYLMVVTEGRTFKAMDIVVYDRKENHKDGRNVLRFDNQTSWLPEKKFKKEIGEALRPE